MPMLIIYLPHLIYNRNSVEKLQSVNILPLYNRPLVRSLMLVLPLNVMVVNLIAYSKKTMSFKLVN